MVASVSSGRSRLLLATLFAAVLLHASVVHATAPPAPPVIAASWSSGVSASSAVLHAEINPEKHTTTYRFEYIAEGADYQAHGFENALKAPAGPLVNLGAGNTDVAVSQPLASLQPATAYHYRPVARSHCNPAELTEVCIVDGPDLTFTTEDAVAGPLLLDARGWEMVSPVEKNGGAIQGPGENYGGGVLQAAAQGDEVTYSSASSFGEGPTGAPPASQYLSTRGEAGWSTANITPPTVSGSYGAEPDGVPYQLFSSDLARGLMLNGVHCRAGSGACPIADPPLPGSGAPAGYQDYYMRDNGSGTYAALVTASDALLPLGPEEFDLAFAGASTDLRHVVLSTCAALTPGATEVPSGSGGCEPEATNLYEWEAGQLRLVGGPFAHLAAPGGAVSADGSRIFFTIAGSLHLYDGGSAEQVDEAGAGAEFSLATPDGTFAFFVKGGSLYRFDAADRHSDLIYTEHAVVGVLGASGDGATIYFQTSTGLYRWSQDEVAAAAAEGNEHVGKVALGSEAAEPSDYPPATGTARVSPDGTRLLFLSSQSLTGYDNVGQASGQPVPEVYLYDAAGKNLTCLSCNPTNERPLGGAAIPGSVANGTGPAATRAYKPRALSADGRRVFFDSSDALVPQDTNNRIDVYEWEAAGEGSCQLPRGCLALVSSGRGSEGAFFIDASADGGDAFFLTTESLAPKDPGSGDVYDARVGGGFFEPPPPIECVGDACQPLPQAPEDPTVGTGIPGPPNPEVRFPKAHCPKGTHRAVRRGKERCLRNHKRHHRKGRRR